MDRLVDLDRLNEARELAHALKGVSGQLAAHPLNAAVGELEVALRRLPGLVRDAKAMIEAAIGAVGKLQDDIDAWPKGRDGTVAERKPDTPRLVPKDAAGDGIRGALSVMIAKNP